MARILIAEDEEHIARLIAFKLKKEGMSAQIACDGGVAGRLLSDEDWDLLILDVMMPVKDGWQVLRELRASARNQSIPVLMLTAHGRLDPALTGDPSWGAFEVISKPFDPSSLSERVREWLEESDRGL